MNRDKAAEILGLTGSFDREDIQDAYEESFFSIRDYFLKNTIVPQLFVSRLERLRKFEEAYSVLTQRDFMWPNIAVPPLPSVEGAKVTFHLDPQSFRELLREYEKKITEVRTHLARSQSIADIIKYTLDLIKVQQAYHVLFLPFAEQYIDESEMDDEVRVGQQVDSGLLLRLMNNENGSEECQDALNTEYARVKKIVALLA